MSDFWRDRAIDAVSVHIEGMSACFVAVPLVVQQLSESMDNAEAHTGGTCYELTWLARLLARRTSFVNSTGTWDELKDVDVLHKYASAGE